MVLQTLFNYSLYLRKYDLIGLTTYHCEPCVSKFRDIRKGYLSKISRKKFLQNIYGIATKFAKSSFLTSRKFETQNQQWYRIKQIKSVFTDNASTFLFLYYFNRGGVEDTRLEAKGTKKIRGQGQGQPFRGQTLSRPRTGMLEAKDKGHRRKCSSKKFFFHAISKKEGLQKIFANARVT